MDKTVIFTRGQSFGYCRLCVCVCVSVNHELVRAITHQPFKLESPNLDQRCERLWLRSLLLFGAIDLELQGQIELESQNLLHPFWACLRDNSPPIEISISKFWPKIHLNTIDFGLDWPWCSVWFFISNLTSRNFMYQHSAITETTAH